MVYVFSETAEPPVGNLAICASNFALVLQKRDGGRYSPWFADLEIGRVSFSDPPTGARKDRYIGARLSWRASARFPALASFRSTGPQSGSVACGYAVLAQS